MPHDDDRDCPSLPEAISRLAHEIRESRKVSAELLHWLQRQSNIEEKLNKIMATQAEQAQILRDNATKLNTIGTDIDDLVQKVTVLEQALENQDNANPELVEAVKAFTDKLEEVDAKYPKLATPPVS